MHSCSGVTAPAACSIRVVDQPRVQAAQEQMPSDEAVLGTADVFGLLSDPGRLRLLVSLLPGEMCVCDLAVTCGQSESSVSHALRLLRAHRVVQVRRDGRRAFYRLDDAHVRMLLDLALSHIAHSGDREVVLEPVQTRP